MDMASSGLPPTNMCSQCGKHVCLHSSERCRCTSAKAATCATNDVVRQRQTCGIAQATCTGLVRRPHDLLGIPPGSPLQVARHAFRERALQAHPDNGGSKNALRTLLAVFHAAVEASVTPTTVIDVAGGLPYLAKARQETVRPVTPQGDRKNINIHRSGASVVHRVSVPRRLRMSPAVARVFALGRLEAALRQAQPEKRRISLDRLSQSAKSALGAFMQVSRRAQFASVPQVPSLAARGSEVCFGSATCSLERVRRNGISVQYRVAEWLPNLGIVIKSQYVSSLKVAVEMCMVLVHVGVTLSRCQGLQAQVGVRLSGVHRANTSSQPGPPDVLLPDDDRVRGCLRAALTEACRGTCLVASDVQLSFCARVWGFCVRNRVDGRCTTSLPEALSHRDMLMDASGTDWPSLRSVLVRIRQSPTRKRLRQLDPQESAQRVDAAFARHLDEELRQSMRAVERLVRHVRSASMGRKTKTTARRAQFDKRVLPALPPMDPSLHTPGGQPKQRSWGTSIPSGTRRSLAGTLGRNRHQRCQFVQNGAFREGSSDQEGTLQAPVT